MNTLFFDEHKKAYWQNSATTPPIQLFELTPHIVGDFPKVFVAISQQGMSACLSYFVQKVDWLNFDNLNENQITRQDYLWKQNCLECFFEFNYQTSYLEMNSSPNGAYNFYTFDEYRTPNTMPPKQDNKASISHILTPHTDDWYIRHIGVMLNAYFAEFSDNGQAPCTISKINPTAILYQTGEPIYYAIKHANPPDFHDKAFWINLMDL